MIDTTLILLLINAFVLTYWTAQRYTATTRSIYTTGSKGYQIFGAIFIFVSFIYFATAGYALLNLIALLMIVVAALWFYFEVAEPRKLRGTLHEHERYTRTTGSTQNHYRPQTAPTARRE